MPIDVVNIFGSQLDGLCKYGLICYFDFFRGGSGFRYGIADVIQCLINVLHATVLIDLKKTEREFLNCSSFILSPFGSNPKVLIKD
ncbi:hypothetical protein IY41_04660 [Phocaeicola dorei]|jgi:hypothetical protein|uniref:Uncharacterized protein n=1 Tax=Phocaeicola dorei TaxID=357276 RepID=A0A0K2HGM1_9BACT|nr:MAG: hypothetical protein GV66_04470 [Phocaeicola dorei]ALA72846.1 hypothetical protein IY41_04660 [Phocaeicola dorei]RGV78006.1 hypothetical protein DWW04_08790 [Phocaeicola dorei]